GRYDEKLTDQAGRFPVSNGTGNHAASIAERTALETENDKRICKQLADHIAEVVKREGAEGWSFAAPASIHASVAELLPPSIRDHISRCDVVVEHPNQAQHSGNPFRVRIDVTVPPGHELVAEEKPTEHDMHEPLSKVINDAFKTMERQLKSLVEKQRHE